MSNILLITGAIALGVMHKKEVVQIKFKAGDEVDLDKDDRLSKEDVERIIKSGTGEMLVVAQEESEPELSQERLEQYVEAIGGLDSENEDDFTKSGKPEVEALKQLLDGDVTASERDTAWEYYQNISE